MSTPLKSLLQPWVSGVVALLCTMQFLHAQTTANLRVPFGRSEITQSSGILFQNALYRWTVRGRGSAGQVIASPTQVDARFFVNNVNIVPGTATPRMPLEVNGTVGAQYCSAFASTPASSPCNIYLAANMTRTSPAQPAVQSRNFRLTNAVQMKPFAFQPDNDVYNPNNIYSATVQGANLPAQLVFVDRLGFNSNAAYNDNEDTLSVRIQRQSPELVLSARPSFAITSVQPARILNDDRPEQPFRDTVLDFGSFRAGSPVQTRRLVLYNRGIEPLSVRVETQNPGNIFSVSSPDGNIGVQRFINSGSDSLVLFFTYQPRTIGSQTLEVRIFTNDTVLSGSDGQGFFRLRLVGATAGGILSITGQASGQFQNNTLLFGTSTGDAASQTFIPIARSFNFSRAASVQEGFTIDSVQRTPNSPFSFNTPDALTLLPFSIDPPPASATFVSTISFRPTRLGDYLDSIVIRGRNLEDYTLYLRGRAEIADATIERTISPINEETLDFGSLVTGSSATRSVIVRNVGNLPLTIQTFVETRGNANEFTALQSTGTLSDTTGTAFVASVRHDARSEFAAGNKEAFLKVEVRNAVTGAFVAERRYTLRANRLPNVLASARSLINFDSVYVGGVRRDTTLIRNGSALYAATLESQRVQALTATASQAFFADAFDTALIARQFGIGARGSAGLRFHPQVRGLDNADFRLASTIDSTGGREELSVLLRGIGVQQQFDLESATSDSMNNSQILPVQASFAERGYRKFTVFVGCVRVGLSRTVRLAFKNNGNLPFAIWNQFPTLSGTNASDSAFSVLRAFPQNRSIAINAQDSSLTILFKPSASGDQTFTYTLFSDIKRTRHISTAPDSVEQIEIELRSTGITPKVEVVERVDFPDNPLGSQCSVQSTLAVVIANATTLLCGTPLSVKAEIIPAGTPFKQVNTIPDILQPGMSTALNIAFSPTSVGDYTATLILTTDAPKKDRISIPLRGRAVNQPSVIMSIPRDIRASPGRRISIPVLITPSTFGSPSLNAQALGLTSTAKFTLNFDATLLAFDSDSTFGTASEGAEIITRDTTSLTDTTTTLNVTIKARGNLTFVPNRERLVTLNFRTYLGSKSVVTPLTLSNDSLLQGTCERVESIRIPTRSGVFALDSVCGLQAKVVSIGNSTFLLSEISPNPVADNARVGFHVAYKTHVTIEILDALGQVKATVADNEFPEGAFEGEVSTVHFSPGVYFCRMRAGRFSGMRKIVIMR